MWVVHWGLLLRLPWRTWVCPCEDQVWKWCSCLGCRGSGSTRYSGELAAKGSRKYSALEVYGNQYWPICSSILAWRIPLRDTEAQQATVHRVAKSLTWPKWPCAHRCKTFLPVAALPEWELSVKVVQLLGLWGPWWRQVCRDTDCLHHRSYGPIRVFFQSSRSWQSEGLFGQSFSVALPVQALTGLPSLGSFSVVWWVRYIEGHLWLQSYAVDWRIRHLKGQPGWGPAP